MKIPHKNTSTMNRSVWKVVVVGGERAKGFRVRFGSVKVCGKRKLATDLPGWREEEDSREGLCMR